MSIEAEILHGDLPLVLSMDSAIGGPGELDSASYRVLAPFPDWEVSLREAGFVQQRKVAGHHAMFVSGTRIGSITGKTCEVDVSCSGLSGTGDKRMRRISCSGQQVAVGPFEKVIVVWEKDEKGKDTETGEDVEKVKRATPKLDELGQPVYEIIATPSGTAERWNIHEAVLTVTDTYYTATAPDTSGVGRPSAPSNPPSVPEFLWGGYDKPVRHNSPSGWVLSSREISEVGPGLWAVTDLFSYYHPFIPD